jgi:hypothetical protein
LSSPLAGAASTIFDLVQVVLRVERHPLDVHAIGVILAEHERLAPRVERERAGEVVRKLRDGQVVATAARPTAALPASGPGVYRLEVMLFGRRSGAYCWGARPWIFTNPIYVLPGDLSFGRMRPRAW